MTVTVAPTVEPSTGPDDPWRVRLDVTATAGETATTVTRLDPDGQTRAVRTTTGVPLPISGGVALTYDYEAPFAAPVRYSTLETPGTLSAEVTLDAREVWLIHPGIPSLSMPVDLLADSFQEETWAVTQGVHWPLGREAAVVQTDGQRKAPAGSLTVAVEGLSTLTGLRTLLRDAGVLLLNPPATLGLGVDPCYIAVGEVRNRRPSDIGSDPYRAVVLPYVVTDPPAGGTQAERTLADIGAPFATLAELGAAYGTLFDMGAG